RMPDLSMAEIWTNTSLAPSSGVMKPNPLVALKNFTVPVWAMGELLHPFSLWCWPPGVGGKYRWLLRRSCVAHDKTPRRKTGPSDIHSIGERVAQTFQSPGRKCPNISFIAQNRE